MSERASERVIAAALGGKRRATAYHAPSFLASKRLRKRHCLLFGFKLAKHPETQISLAKGKCCCLVRPATRTSCEQRLGCLRARQRDIPARQRFPTLPRTTKKTKTSALGGSRSPCRAFCTSFLASRLACCSSCEIPGALLGRSAPSSATPPSSAACEAWG